MAIPPTRNNQASQPATAAPDEEESGWNRNFITKMIHFRIQPVHSLIHPLQTRVLGPRIEQYQRQEFYCITTMRDLEGDGNGEENYLPRNCNNWRQIVINKIINFGVRASWERRPARAMEHKLLVRYLCGIIVA